MARVRKPKPTLDSIFFVTPEQKLIRFLLSEPTSTYTPRVLSSKLKGVRGLGGAEGIMKILGELHELGLVQFHDNNRAVMLQNEVPTNRLLKQFIVLCDLEGLVELLVPISDRGILYGSRARGEARTDSDYNLFVVSRSPQEVVQVCAGHPMGKKIEVKVVSPDEFADLESKNAALAKQIDRGISLWGSKW